MLHKAAALVFSAVFAASTPGSPIREAPTATEAKAAMRRLAYLAGTWEGEGWMDMGGTRRTFRGRELVQAKLDGVALLVEGHFLAKVGPDGAEVPVHSTLGVIFHDAETKTYRFHSWLAAGTSGQRELTVDAEGWRWEMQGPRGTVRYVMKLTPEGDWYEIGERSADGKTWTQFFEMTLKKA